MSSVGERFAAPPARCGDALCPRRQARSPCSPRACSETEPGSASPTVQHPHGSARQRKSRRLATPTCADPSQVLRRSNRRRWQGGLPATTAFISFRATWATPSLVARRKTPLGCAPFLAMEPRVQPYLGDVRAGDLFSTVLSARVSPAHIRPRCQGASPRS